MAHKQEAAHRKVRGFFHSPSGSLLPTWAMKKSQCSAAAAALGYKGPGFGSFAARQKIQFG